MAKRTNFNSIEELLALRTNKPSPIRVVDNPPVGPKYGSIENPYVFKRVKNSTCGWEVDYKDQREDIPGQLELED